MPEHDHTDDTTRPGLERRTFLTRVGVGTAAAAWAAPAVLSLDRAAAAGTPAPTTTTTAGPTTTTTAPPAGFACDANAFGVIATFNEFVFGNSNRQGTDVEGRLAVGGNLILGAYACASEFPASNALNLVVGGTLNWNGGSLKGTGTYGTAGGTIQNVGLFNGPITQAAPPFSFSSLKTTMLNKSAGWAAFIPPAANQGTVAMPFSTLQLTGTASNLNVFNCTATQFANASGIELKVPQGSTTLVNVSGTNITKMPPVSIWTGSGFTQCGNNDCGAYGNSVRAGLVWNFYQATSMTVTGTSPEGLLLGPKMSLTFNGAPWNGTIVVDSFNGANNGESHNFPFTGTCLPAV